MNPSTVISKAKGFIKDSKNNSKTISDMRIINVRVMGCVGGYDQFLTLPIPAYIEIVRGLQAMDKLQFEKEKAMFGGSKGKGLKK